MFFSLFLTSAFKANISFFLCISVRKQDLIAHVTQAGLRLCVAEVDLELLVFLPFLLKCQNYRQFMLGIGPRA